MIGLLECCGVRRREAPNFLKQINFIFPDSQFKWNEQF